MNTTNKSPATVDILPLPAFNDNYIWILRAADQAVAVDPGDAAPVLDYLHATGGKLAAILITHHHGDHVGGIARLLSEAPRAASLPVYGPAGETIAGVTHRLKGGEQIMLASLATELEVIDVPGHTAGHIAYYGRKLGQDGALFCGDTLFGGGCGRLFEGTPAQMQASLAQFAVLPAPTSVYCAHEYTQSNLRFALAVEPDNSPLQQRIRQVEALRAGGRSTVPLLLSEELATNPFLRWDAPAVRAAAQTLLGRPAESASETFAAIRKWKDGFR